MSWTHWARFLDGLTALLLALTAALLLTGGWTVPLGPWQLPITRPEDALLATLPVLAIRWWLRPPRLPAMPPRRVLAIGAVSYCLIFSFITVSRHYTFMTHALDLGYYVQVLWNLTQGRGAYVSLPEMHAWGDHFSPILYLFVPLFGVFPGAVVLLVAQTVCLALGALAVFAIARRPLGDERLAVVFAGLYLLNPSLHGINVRDFHPAALSIPLLLAAVACFDANRPTWFLATVLLTLSTREDAALAVIGLGLWIALRRRRWGWGIGLAGLGFGWLFLTTGWLMPSFRGGPYGHLDRFTHLGGSVGEILINMVIHPFAALSFMVSGRRLIYVLALFAPFAFLPLLSPLDLLPALPTLVMNLQSRDPVLFHHRTQYAAFILPFVVLAAVSGYRRLARWMGEEASEHGPRVTPRAVLAFAVLLSLALSSRTLNELGVNKWKLSDRQRKAYAVMARIPPGAAVSTWDRFVPHLSLRSKVFVFPVGLDRSEYVLLDLDAGLGRNPVAALDRQGDRVVIRAGGLEYRYAVVTEEARYLVLRRAPSESLFDCPLRCKDMGRVMVDHEPAAPAPLEEVGGQNRGD